jgi:plastocyanin
MKKSINFVFLCFAVLFVVLLSACGAAGEAEEEAVTGDISVEITAETCPEVVAKAGDEVMWVNKDTRGHIIQAKLPDGRALFVSSVLQPDATYSYIFAEAGSYNYTCTMDGMSKGTITIEP